MTKTKQTFIKILSVVLSVVMLTAVLATLSGCKEEPLVEYSLTYELGGGTNHADNPEIYTTNDFPLIIKQPTRDGFTFLGWTSEIHEVEEPDLTLLLGDEQNLTLIAVWEQNLGPGNIKYMLGTGGTNSADNPYSFTAAQLPVVIDGVPTREGYTFKGWTVGNDKTVHTSVTVNEFSYFVLTAVWDKNMSEGYGEGKLLAPDFEFKDESGKTVKLSDYRGVKPVFLSFFVTSCEYCKEEIKNVFNTIYDSTFIDEFELIVICCDPANLGNYAQKNNVKFPIYTTAGGVSGYTDNSWPRNYMIDKWGYLFNDKRPVDITKPPLNNFDCGTFENVAQMKNVINGAIARASK